MYTENDECVHVPVMLCEVSDMTYSKPGDQNMIQSIRVSSRHMLPFTQTQVQVEHSEVIHSSNQIGSKYS